MLNHSSYMSGKSGKCQEKKLHIHVRRENIHATYTLYVTYDSFRNIWTARNVEYATYILNTFHMYGIHGRYMSNTYYSYEIRVCYIKLFLCRICQESQGNVRKKVCATYTYLCNLYTCMMQEIYMPHICRMYLIMHLLIQEQRLNVLHATYISNIFHIYGIHVRCM